MMVALLHVSMLLSCCAFMMLLQASASAAAKLAFLTPPRQHHRCKTSLPTRASKIYSLPRLHDSRLKAASDSGDDDSICDVYQQVKEEDSEWYSMISQMLGNDEMDLLDTTFTCGDEKEAEVTSKSNAKSNQVVEEEASKQDTNDSSRKEDANYVVSTTDANKLEATEDESPEIQDSVEAPVAGSHSEGHYTQFLDDDNEEEEDVKDNRDDNSNIDTKSKVESSHAAKKEDVESKQNQGQDDEVEAEQTQPSSIVRIYNEFTKEYENIAPLSALEKLGYSEKELKLLRPQVLELIVDDRIPRPRRGIPKRWVKSLNDDQYDEEEERYDDDFGWQVQVVSQKKPKIRSVSQNIDNEQRMNEPKDVTLEARDERIDNNRDVAPATRRSNDSSEDKPLRRVKDDSRIEDVSSRANRGETVDSEFDEANNEPNQPRTRQQEQSSSEYEQEYRRKRGYRPPPQKRRQPQPVRDDGYDERPDLRRARRPRGSNRRQRTPKRQELLIDRDSYGDDPSGNKFWMGLPMFKDFLRKEAQFRLKILGPDWKESVMDESRWRYDLYKTWLQMIDEGVGENPLYTYSDQPRQRRRSSRTQSDANYERETDSRAAPRRRVPRSQPDVRRRKTMDDDDDGFYDYEEPRRNQKLDVEEVEQGGRARRAEQTKRPRRQTRSSQPPRNERWTNFNDLEESLLKSKGDPQGSREEYSRRSSDSYDDERSRRRRRTSDVYNEDEESAEDETPRRRYSTDAYVDSLEEDIQPQRRRRRVRRDISFEEDDL